MPIGSGELLQNSRDQELSHNMQRSADFLFALLMLPNPDMRKIRPRIGSIMVALHQLCGGEVVSDYLIAEIQERMKELKFPLSSE